MPFFPPEAVVPESWPPLPVDLYFLRDAQLWHWSAEGGSLEELPLAEGALGVLDYRVAAESRHLAYLDSAGHLYVLDGSTGEQQRIPIMGELSTEFNEWGDLLNPDGSFEVFLDQFDLTPDGRYLIYLAWGRESSTCTGCDLKSGTLFAVDLQDPRQQLELGACTSDVRDWEIQIVCRGFALAPDGRQVAFSEAQGLWVAQIPGGEARLLAASSRDVMPTGCGVTHPRSISWSPDQQWLLLQIGCYEGAYWTVVNAHTGQVVHFPDDTFFYMDRHVEGVWGPTGVWMTEIFSKWVEGVGSTWQGRLYLAQLHDGESLQIVRSITETVAGFLRPVAPYPLSEGRVGFAHQGCAGLPGPEPAILFLEIDSTLEQVARLPAQPCRLSECDNILWASSISWSPDGLAFLYLEGRRIPTLLGLTDGSVLWDVQELLEGAHHFRWGPAGLDNPR